MSEQALKALKQANEVKYEIYATRREIKALPRLDGMRMVAGILEDEDRLSAIRLDYLVSSIRRIGHDQAHRVIISAGVHPGRWDYKLGRLTLRERLSVADVLRDLGNA